MAKLYFKYGVMGASKSAQALITKFNYEENNNKVLLLKPAVDTRDGKTVIKSRIGMEADAIAIENFDDIYFNYSIGRYGENFNVIICDESQFFTPKHIEQLKKITLEKNVPVICYGLLSDFQTNLFPGSKRLVELADSLQEIKMVCGCGAKATVNARFIDGKIALDGEQIVLGGNDSYKGMCYRCFDKLRTERYEDLAAKSYIDTLSIDDYRDLLEEGFSK